MKSRLSLGIVIVCVTHFAFAQVSPEPVEKKDYDRVECSSISPTGCYLQKGKDGAAPSSYMRSQVDVPSSQTSTTSYLEKGHDADLCVNGSDSMTAITALTALLSKNKVYIWGYDLTIVKQPFKWQIFINDGQHACANLVKL